MFILSIYNKQNVKNYSLCILTLPLDMPCGLIGAGGSDVLSVPSGEIDSGDTTTSTTTDSLTKTSSATASDVGVGSGVDVGAVVGVGVDVGVGSGVDVGAVVGVGVDVGVGSGVDVGAVVGVDVDVGYGSVTIFGCCLFFDFSPVPINVLNAKIKHIANGSNTAIMVQIK